MPVQPLGTDTTAFGTFVFYEYQKNDQCGFGYAFSLGVGQGGGGSFSALGQPPLQMYYGRIRDTKAVRVTVLVPGAAEPLDARLVGQVWYVMYPGQLDGRGPVVVKAFDQAGTLLHSTGTGGK